LTKKRYSQILLREWGVITFYILHKFMPLWQQHESKKIYDFPIKLEAKTMIIADREYLENSNKLSVCQSNSVFSVISIRSESWAIFHQC
jgi:hypothetical protein